MLDICRYILSGAGYRVVGVADAEAAVQLLRDQHFDLVLCDIMLPQASGLSLCRTIRTTSDIPVCFLTAKGSPEERVAGFEAGADDYIVKPFNARELLMRVAVILRRGAPDELSNGPLVIARGSTTARVAGRRVLLSEPELRLLTMLLERKGEAVAWQELVRAAWLTDAPETGKDMLKTTVHRLRVKLGETSQPLIVSVRGTGYAMPQLPTAGPSRRERGRGSART